MALNVSPARRRIGRPGSGRRGFTLLEMLLVLFLAGMLAAIVVPSFFGTLETADLRKGASEVRATLKLARALAAARVREKLVTFNPETGEYGIAGEARGRRLPEGIRFVSIRVGERLVERDRPGTQGEIAAVRFFPDGSAEETEVVLSSGGDGRMRIAVDPVTGMVEAGA